MRITPFRLAIIYGLKTSDYDWLATFYPVRRLREECEKRSISVQFFLPENVPALFEHNADVADLFLLRGDIPDFVYDILETRHQLFVNTREAAQAANDKSVIYRLLAGTSIEMPHRYTVGGITEKDFPLVIKPRFGSQGRGVTLIKDHSALVSFIQDNIKRDTGFNPEADVIIQQFMKDSFGRDLRVLFCDGKITGCFRRTSSEFRSNSTAGSKTEAVHLPVILNEWTHIIMEKTKLFTGTADYLYSNSNPHGFVLCEVNASPGFLHTEKDTGSNIAGAFIDAISAYMAH